MSQYPDYVIDEAIQNRKDDPNMNKCMVCGKTLRTKLDKAVGECKQCREGE